MSNATERLATIRQEIDQVDAELLAILNRRAALSIEVGHIKAEDTSLIFKPQREIEVLASLEEKNTGPLPNPHMRTIWREIFSSSRALQKTQRVAYLGPEGTFSYFAAIEYLGKSVELQACTNFEDVFRAVCDSQCQLGVIPLENSLQGTVGQCFDLFHRFDVTIQAELFLRISHGLLSTHTSFTNIKRIYSHPQAIAQCDPWIRANMPWAELVPVESTGAAARRAAQDTDSAAIGHVSLASMFSLNILAASIESSNDNWTRFVVISLPSVHTVPSIPQASVSGNHAVPSNAPKKSSVLFTLHDQPGSLSAVLQIFAEEHVNMRKLESRPLRLSGGECWRYVFFADLEADLHHARYAQLIEHLRTMCNSFRVLGVYPTVPAFTEGTSPMISTSHDHEGSHIC